MSHPFEKLFDMALAKSSSEGNLVVKEAQKLLEKGYREEEVCGVLEKLEKGLIDDAQAALVREAREEVCENDDED